MLSANNMRMDLINTLGQLVAAGQTTEEFIFIGDFAKFSTRIESLTA